MHFLRKYPLESGTGEKDPFDYSDNDTEFV